MSEALNLEDVLALGGTREDFEMLQDIDNDEKPKKRVDKAVKEKEIKQIVGKLGFDSLPAELLQAPKKLLSAKKPISNKIKKDVLKNKLKQRTKNQNDIVKKPWTEKVEPQSESIYGKLPKRLLIKNAGPWFENFQDDVRARVDGDQPFVKPLKEYAMNLLENERSLRKGKNHNQSNDVWMNTVAAAGTLSDRVASLTLMLHKAPVHNLHCFENLLAMSKKKGKREAIRGFEAIRDLLLGDLIPDNRKLRNFLQHPLNIVHSSLEAKNGSGEWSVESCQTRLILWAFEHRLKELITVFIDQLKALARDTMEVSKTKAMSIALNLLMNKPEQEGSLLALLVNKLGDPKYKIASKALNMLNRVVSHHPMMQAIIVREVRDLLLIPNLASRAQYYCVCFLSSQILSHERKDVAQNLIQIYMNFFKYCVKKKNSSENKMLSALLTGVNRAFPYADLADETVVSELDILFRTVHVASISTAIQSLVLIFQVYDSRGETSDRFNNALYAALFHPELPLSTHRHPMFLNLLYRALKADPCEPRIKAFVKRTLQACSLQLPAFCTAVLTMVAELVRTRPSLECKFLNLTGSGKKTPAEDESDVKSADVSKWNDDEEEHFVDIKEGSDVEEGDEQQGEEKQESWVHKHKQSMKFSAGVYDPTLRNPQYCGSENTSIWELHAFTRHFHPTVALYANKLLKPGGSSEPNKGDPLEDYTLIKFLDRFVYRNPKSNNAKPKSKNHPALSIHTRKRHASFVDALPVNTLEFLQKDKFDPEEVFYQRYFSSQPRRRKREKNVEITDLSDDEFDEFMNSAGGQKKIDQELKFSDHIYKNKSSKGPEEFDDFEVDSDDDFDAEGQEGYGFEMEEGEEDLLDEGGVFVTDINEKRKAERRTESAKRRKMSGDEFGMMLEENTDEFDTTSSMAVSNRDQSSAKQLRWESKQQQKEALRKKKEWRRKDKSTNFGKNKGKRNSFKKPRKR